jgi:aryl-phospho-beta-D-glucosidase BglC (GH1 family)
MRLVFYILFLPLLVPVTASAKDELPRLRVEANTLVNPAGKPITLRGVSLCSLSWNNPLRLLDTLVHGKKGWHVNVVRLPVQPTEWEKEGPESYLKERLDPAVRQCRAGRVYCIIDWHEIAGWKDPGTIRKLETFWRVVAPRYANDPFIMYEVFNEPTEPKDRDRDNWLSFRAQAQKWVDMIRRSAPDTILLIGSPHWSQMPAFAVQDPVSGNNLMYTLHLYHGWPEDAWDDLFGGAQPQIPLFVSEWGWSSLWRNRLTPFYGTKESYAVPLRAYFDARPHVSWTAWSYDPECGPAMTGKDAEMGSFVREWLQSYR